MTTTNKLVRLEDIYNILLQAKDIPNIGINTLASIQARVTEKAFEPIKGSNHALLQGYIDAINPDAITMSTLESRISMLREIQSRLTEGTEYIIGKEYEFSDDGEKWIDGRLRGFSMKGFESTPYNYIRPIQTVSPELTSAISVLEANGYTVSKK